MMGSLAVETGERDGWVVTVLMVRVRVCCWERTGATLRGRRARALDAERRRTERERRRDEGCIYI